MSAGDADAIGWRGDIAPALRAESNPGIRLQLGGAMLFSVEGYGFGLMLKYNDEAAYYWTSTIDEESTTGDTMVFYRKLAAGQDGVERRHGPIHLRYIAVRWVRDAQ